MSRRTRVSGTATTATTPPAPSAMGVFERRLTKSFGAPRQDLPARTALPTLDRNLTMSSTRERREFLRLVACTAALSPFRACTVSADPRSATPSRPGRVLPKRARALASVYREADETLPPAPNASTTTGSATPPRQGEGISGTTSTTSTSSSSTSVTATASLSSVYRVADGKAVENLYSPDLFDFGKNDIADDLDSVSGFAGLRILYPLNTSEYRDELGAFLGASYFRLLGETMLYGLSARGLAINTAGEGSEEFPVFREFDLEVPSEPDRLVMHALLDSPSVSGAYRFVIQPGADTVIETRRRSTRAPTSTPSASRR